MTLFELFKKIEQCCLNLLKVYKSLKEHESSKEYNLTCLSLNRSFGLKTFKIASELEKQAYKLFKEKIPAFLYRNELENLLPASGKIVLQRMEGLAW